MGDNWFVAIEGKQEGPFSSEQILANLQQGIFKQTTYVWKQGFANWKEISQCPDLSSSPSSLPPNLPLKMGADQIDYEIFGSEMQFVEIELDPQESVVAEAGSMMYMSNFIQMETVFGDGS